MNEIAVNTEMTFPEYRTCQSALLYGKLEPTFLWSVLTIGAAPLLVARNSSIWDSKRNIPPDGVNDFIQLLRTHRLLPADRRPDVCTN